MVENVEDENLLKKWFEIFLIIMFGYIKGYLSLLLESNDGDFFYVWLVDRVIMLFLVGFCFIVIIWFVVLSSMRVIVV